MSDNDQPSMRGRATNRAGLLTELLDCPCCKRAPHILQGVTRDGREPYANIFCRFCWRPGEKSCRGILALGSTQEEAAAKWNQQVADSASLPEGTA